MKETLLIFMGMILCNVSYSQVDCELVIDMNNLPSGSSWQGQTTYEVSAHLYELGTTNPINVNTSHGLRCFGAAQACGTLNFQGNPAKTDLSNGLIGFFVTQTSNVPTGVIKNVDIEIFANADGCNAESTLDAVLGATLPINLVKFELEKAGQKILLTWTTASERDNEAFFIERSTDGLSFEAIGRVEGAGNSYTMQSYSFEDKELPKSARMVYYRLKQVDFDGSFEYSSIKNVILDADQHVNIEKIRTRKAGFSGTIMADRECEAELFITNLSGQVLKAQSVWMEKGVNNVDLDISSPDGIYFFTLKTQWGVTTRKFLKG